MPGTTMTPPRSQPRTSFPPGRTPAPPPGATAREYDESDLGAEYDGDLDALTAGDQLPARQESRAATWGDNPEYDESDLGAGVRRGP